MYIPGDLIQESKTEARKYDGCFFCVDRPGYFFNLVFSPRIFLQSIVCLVWISPLSISILLHRSCSIVSAAVAATRRTASSAEARDGWTGKYVWTISHYTSQSRITFNQTNEDAHLDQTASAPAAAPRS